jgi:3',5'-cyclic AMP phosphodiesterase CpdA
VSAAQVKDVAGWLMRQSARATRVLVVHHPVTATTDDDRINVLRGAEPALRAWAAAGADVVLSGHIHLPFVVPLHERLPGLQRRIWAVNAGTAVSRRVRAGAPPSFNLLRAPSGLCVAPTLERWDFDLAAAEFVCVERRELARDR